MKRILSLFLTVIILFSTLTVVVYADRDISEQEILAQELKELGLFKGVSDTDFDLDRAPSRVEALVMLIRVLGRESEVAGGVWRHPFTDVPEWADKYVGFAYSNGLTNGQSLTEFGTGDASAAMFVTFVLRALGYSDANGADFVWNDPFTLAKTVGILPDSVNLDEFWRADVVTVAHSSLVANLKGSEQTLAQKLISAGCFTAAKFNSCYNGAIANLPLTELTAEQIYKECSGAVFYIEIYDAKGKAVSSGSGFFIDDKGTAVTNYHVIDDVYSAKAQMSGSGTVYDVVGIYDYDIKNDWAVIKVNCTGNDYLKIGDASTAAGGATIYTIGSPLGLQNTISQGLVSNPARVEDGVKYIQISAAISSGSSGGALINKYGEVIGITSGGYVYGQNLNLAVPMTALEGYTVNSLIELENFESTVDYNLAKVRQQTAYDLLKMFVFENYNVTREGKKEYNEKLKISDNEEFMIGVNYNDDNEQLVICAEYYLENKLTYSLHTSLDRTKKYGSSHYYDFTHSTAYNYFTYGYRNVSFANFNKDFDYTFENYTGAQDRIERNGNIAKELHFVALDFVDTIFLDHFDGEYSVVDFGYTSFDLHELRFTEIIVEEKNQLSAYAILENFILDNYTEITSKGFKSYTETLTSDGVIVAVGMYYDDEDDFIVANIGYYSQSARTALYIDFLPGDKDVYVEYYLENADNDEEIFGRLVMNNCDFNIDSHYRFDEYEGDAEVREACESISKVMHCQILAFVDLIFENILEVDYSVADFGYTTFNAEDFR